ncbi:programmed cell death protein 2-like isoform X2 [Toxorhynchites rutilus septentrionalis]|uniref:programmed cell death protein 2-like isoform X2 n=1 Tax=Toxorhynchites rutilus septentrionalis TaxID=329112 RepID=UPI002479F260|nr:programmed cell death protein 2-like isoform X2 [Toxorhynchites rutilus septentrionalis]
MAKNKCVVLLGYEDEPITEKDKPYLNHTVNKIGGVPNWPSSEIAIAPCPLCGQNRSLIMQIYAPLENSQFHRTLYIFACLNAPCSTQSQSWICVRAQALEKSPVDSEAGLKASNQVVKNTASNISWCSGADDWDDDGASAAITYMRVDTENIPDLANEENGNIIRYEPSRISDEDDESNSLENDPVPGFGKLRVDEKNANGAAAQDIIVDNPYACKATAEIEGMEEGVILVETPVSPKRDLIALLKQPQIIPRDVINLTLSSSYISVDEERSSSPNISDHVRELLQEYQKKEEVKTSPDSPVGQGIASGGQPAIGEQELYEKDAIIHGDTMFHSFLTKLQKNPGQILRYSRNAQPVLIAPLKEVLSPRCQHCGSELICEVQILPTLIDKLRLEATGDRVPIDFGTILIWTCMKSCWDTPDRMRTEMLVSIHTMNSWKKIIIG